MSQQAYALIAFAGTAKNGFLTEGTFIESQVFDVNLMRPLGNFAGQLLVSGAGNVDIDLYTSINGTTFVKSRNLFEAASATDGPAADGEQLESLGMEVCMKFKFKATEKSGTDAATVSLWIGVQ